MYMLRIFFFHIDYVQIQFMLLARLVTMTLLASKKSIFFIAFFNYYRVIAISHKFEVFFVVEGSHTLDN